MFVLGRFSFFKGDPLVNLAGSYFPGWLACMLIGLVGTWILVGLARRVGWSEVVRPEFLMISAIFIGVTCGAWMVIFSA
jgi:hypothetical protein